MFAKIKRITTSPLFTLLLAAALIIYSVYDIYEEFFDPSHEHILIIIGLFMGINAIRHLVHGINTIARLTISAEETMLDRSTHFLERPIVNILLAVMIIVTSAYGIYKDVTEIMTKGLSIMVGVIMILIVLLSTYEGLAKISKTNSPK